MIVMEIDRRGLSTGNYFQGGEELFQEGNEVTFSNDDDDDDDDDGRGRVSNSRRTFEGRENQ